MGLFLKDVFLIPFKCAGIEAFIILVQKILVGLTPMLNIVFVTKFIDSVTKLIDRRGSYPEVLFSITMIALLSGFNVISNSITKFLSESMEIKIKKEYKSKLIKKIASLKYYHIENDETQNLIARISKDIEKTIKSAYVDILSLCSIVLRIVGIISVVFYYSLIAGIAMSVVCIPMLYIAIKGGNQIYNVAKEVAKNKRKSAYIASILTDRESVYEKSLFNFTSTLADEWFEFNKNIIEKEFKAQKKVIVDSNNSGVAAVVAGTIISLIFLVPLRAGTLSIGSFIALTNAVFGIRQYVTWGLARVVSQTTKNYRFYEDLRKITNLEEEEGALVEANSNMKIDTLEFKNVSFKYPECDNYIFKNLSFKIESGKHYSIVGANGSGKTTITKLITGLYTDFEGDIFINGKSIKTLDSSEVKGLTTLVYQDFAKYFISIKENIAVGNIKKIDEKEFTNEITKVVNLVGMEKKIDNLEQGLETHLGKIKEKSIDLSGGQWQKLAMARSLVNDASLRILDEPTAALDPISESKVYESFEKISKDKTTIFISHRLGSTKIADEILVLQDGVLVEQGEHEKLIEAKGTYAKMYESQKEWYAC